MHLLAKYDRFYHHIIIEVDHSKHLYVFLFDNTYLYIPHAIHLKFMHRPAVSAYVSNIALKQSNMDSGIHGLFV